MRDRFGFRDELVIASRNALSVLPKLGLVKRPNFHRKGISFIIPVKDEEKWIKPCILSVEPVADEIIVVDSSIEDNTTAIVDSLAERYDKIKHVRFYWQAVNAFALSLHIGLVSSSFKWVFKWDSDYVAKSTEALMEWKNRLFNLDQSRYHVIDIPRVNLEGDLAHQPRNCPFGIYEGRLFNWSPELRWSLKENYYSEQVYGDSIWGHRFPPWYKLLRWHEPYVFHCNIKNPLRMVMRKFWDDFVLNRDPRFKSLLEYTTYRVNAEWHLSMEEAQKKVMDEHLQNLVPYDKAQFGELPKILTELDQKI